SSFAYTVDGGPLGELQYESFNAAAAKIKINGNNVHPGTAKNKMVNAVKIASELIEKFPKQEAPEYTEGYEGFYHLLSVSGDVEQAEVYYIIRDHDRAKFEERKRTVENIVREIKEEYGNERISLDLQDQYYNMRDKIEPVKEIVELA